jgi:hypothetical protein
MRAQFWKFVIPGGRTAGELICDSHRKHFHNLVPQMIDNFYRDAT